MKKILSLILIISFAFSVSLQPVSSAVKKKRTVIKAGVKKTVKREIPKKKEYTPPIFEDEFANELKELNITNKKITKYKTAVISDEEVIYTEANKNFKKTIYTGQIKTENGLKVVLKPITKIKTKTRSTKIQDTNNEISKFKTPMPALGEQVAFKVAEDVIKDEKLIIPKDTIVYARISEVSPRAMGGAPAEMTIENFEIMDKNGNLSPLDGQISCSGYSLSLWISIAELATTPFLFGLAVPLLRLLPGGQAVVTPKKGYIVYY